MQSKRHYDLIYKIDVIINTRPITNKKENIPDNI